MLGLTTADWFAVLSTVAAILAAVFSKRASSWAKAGSMSAKLISRILGKPDNEHARPTTGITITQKVETLGENDVAFADNQLVIAKNQVLIAESLRIIADELSAIRGTGKRRLPTDAITIPATTSAIQLIRAHDDE